MLRLVLLGRPGAGKGTQGVYISKKFGVPRLVMSDLLREEVHKGTELGREIKRYMVEGKLVPDEIVYQVLRKRLIEVKEGFILDGFPRNLNQAEWLDKFTQENNAELTAVLYFSVDEIAVLRRIMGRLMCKKCGRSYNIFYDPPPDVRRCECGGTLYQREDDHYEKILRRLDVFNEETKPLVEYYAKKNLLVTIDANKGIEAVKDDVSSVLDSLLRKRVSP